MHRDVSRPELCSGCGFNMHFSLDRIWTHVAVRPVQARRCWSFVSGRIWRNISQRHWRPWEFHTSNSAEISTRDLTYCAASRTESLDHTCPLLHVQTRCKERFRDEIDWYCSILQQQTFSLKVQTYIFCRSWCWPLKKLAAILLPLPALLHIMVNLKLSIALRLNGQVICIRSHVLPRKSFPVSFFFFFFFFIDFVSTLHWPEFRLSGF